MLRKLMKWSFIPAFALGLAACDTGDEVGGVYEDEGLQGEEQTAEGGAFEEQGGTFEEETAEGGAFEEQGGAFEEETAEQDQSLFEQEQQGGAEMGQQPQG